MTSVCMPLLATELCTGGVEEANANGKRSCHLIAPSSNFPLLALRCGGRSLWTRMRGGDAWAVHPPAPEPSDPSSVSSLLSHLRPHLLISSTGAGRGWRGGGV